MDPITIGIIALAGWALCKKKTGNQDDEKQHEEPVQDYKVYSNKDAQLKTKSYEYFSEIVHEDTPPEQIGIALNRDKFYYKGGRKIFRSSNDIEYIVEYHPYYMHGERNPNFDYASSKILDVKKMRIRPFIGTLKESKRLLAKAMSFVLFLAATEMFQIMVLEKLPGSYLNMVGLMQVSVCLG